VNRRELLKILGSMSGSLVVPFTLHNMLCLNEINQIDDLSFQKIEDKLKKEPPAKSEIKIERGGPRLFINGKEVYPLFAWSWKLLKYTPDFKAAGINIIYPILQVSDGWLAKGQYDWQKFETFLFQLLKLNPDAYFLPRLLLYAPDWWKDKHPDQLIQTCIPFDSKYNKSTPELLIGEGGQRWWRDNPKEVSFASAIWKDDTGLMLTNFLNYFKNSALRSRIFGYHIGLGTTGGEWHYSHSMFLPDMSGVMKKKIGFVPDEKTRLHTCYGLFRDPGKEKDIIDFYEKFHDINANTILYFANIIKTETQRKLICGVFYNYVLENVWMQEGGHLSPEKILTSKDLDFIASPYTYQSSNVKGSKKGETDIYDQAGNYLGRGRGVAGDGGYRLLTESIKRYGKLPFVEMDPATFIDKGRDAAFAGSGSNTPEGSIKLLKRDLGQMFVTGSGGWLCDIGAVKGDGWYAEKNIITAIKNLTSIGARRNELDVSSISQIAAVYDTKSFFVTKHWKAEQPYEKGAHSMDYFGQWFLNSQARALHRIGAPVDFLYRFDLETNDVRKYKLFLMVNLFYLFDKEVDFLLQLFNNSKATVVWYYAPGFVSPSKLNLKQMEKLTGFQFKIIEEPGSMKIRAKINDEVDKFNLTFGTQKERFPRFAVINKNMNPLGYWLDRNEVAFAWKENDGWNSVYVGATPLPIKILRWLVKKSGAELWSSKPDIVRASKDAAMVVATSTGERTIRFHKFLKDVEANRAFKKEKIDMEMGDVKIFVNSKS
jgi:hypothetical protein